MATNPAKRATAAATIQVGQRWAICDRQGNTLREVFVIEVDDMFVHVRNASTDRLSSKRLHVLLDEGRLLSGPMSATAALVRATDLLRRTDAAGVGEVIRIIEQAMEPVLRKEQALDE